MMDHLQVLEQHYKTYTQDLTSWVRDGVVNVDLDLLQKMDLLPSLRSDSAPLGLTRFFHVIKSSEKITLINEEFVVWIVSEFHSENPKTYTLIALNNGNSPHLELVFVTSGVYNISRFVLRILDRFLTEIQENEHLLRKLQ